MFRLWGKLFKDTHMIKDFVVEDNSDLNRTKKIFNAIDKLCLEFDLSTPIWLESNINTFKKISKTRFTSDNFVEPIEFDYFEIHIIEED